MASFNTEAVSSSTREKPRLFASASACSNNRRPIPLPRALDARYIFRISQMLADVVCSPTEPTICPFSFTSTSNVPPLRRYSASISWRSASVPFGSCARSYSASTPNTRLSIAARSLLVAGRNVNVIVELTPCHLLVINRSAFRDINIHKGRRQIEGRPSSLRLWLVLCLNLGRTSTFHCEEKVSGPRNGLSFLSMFRVGALWS